MLPNLWGDKATFDTIHAKLYRSLVYRERSDVFGKPDLVAGMLFVGIQRLQANASPEKLLPSPLCQDLDCPGTVHGSSAKTPTSILVFNVKWLWQDRGVFLTIRSTGSGKPWEPSGAKGPNCHLTQTLFMCRWECPTNAHKQMHHLGYVSPFTALWLVIGFIIIYLKLKVSSDKMRTGYHQACGSFPLSSTLE